MKTKFRVLPLLVGLLFLPLTWVSAQSCNPAVVDYIVRDENGNVLSEAELKTIHQQLPETIGNANTAVAEVSFTGDGQTYYWPESVEWNKGKKFPALEFANAGTCTLEFPQVDLVYHGKKMSLIFNVSIKRHQDDRRPVIDSLPFQDGTFVLDLSGWTRRRDEMIPATLWRTANAQKDR